jgi:hypothetical protein
LVGSQFGRTSTRSERPHFPHFTQLLNQVTKVLPGYFETSISA